MTYKLRNVRCKEDLKQGKIASKLQYNSSFRHTKDALNSRQQLRSQRHAATDVNNNFSTNTYNDENTTQNGFKSVLRESKSLKKTQNFQNLRISTYSGNVNSNGYASSGNAGSSQGVEKTFTPLSKITPSTAPLTSPKFSYQDNAVFKRIKQYTSSQYNRRVSVLKRKKLTGGGVDSRTTGIVNKNHRDTKTTDENSGKSSFRFGTHF